MYLCAYLPHGNIGTFKYQYVYAILTQSNRCLPFIGTIDYECSWHSNIAPESHDFSSPLRKSNAKVSILFFFFLVLSSFSSSITQKVYGISKRSAHQMNALLSEIFLILVRAACELRSMSYGPKHTSRFLSCTPFCVCLHTQLDN